MTPLTYTLRIYGNYHQRLAYKKVRSVRYRKYGQVAFHADFVHGPGEVLAGGAAIKRVASANNDNQNGVVTALVGIKRE